MEELINCTKIFESGILLIVFVTCCDLKAFISIPMHYIPKVKSMHVYADRMQMRNRSNLFSSLFIDDLSRIVSIITQEIMNKFLKVRDLILKIVKVARAYLQDVINFINRYVLTIYSGSWICTCFK